MMDGQLVDVDGITLLRFERTYHYAITDVWDAITDAERSGRWAFPTTFEPRVGGLVEIDLGPYGVAHGEVLAWDEPRLLEYRWTEAGGGGDETWHIRFALEPSGDSTILVFDHHLPTPGRPEFAAGWHWYLDRLEQVLTGNPPERVETDAEFEQLLVRYSTRL